MANLVIFILTETKAKRPNWCFSHFAKNQIFSLVAVCFSYRPQTASCSYHVLSVLTSDIRRAHLLTTFCLLVFTFIATRIFSRVSDKMLNSSSTGSKSWTSAVARPTSFTRPFALKDKLLMIPGKAYGVLAKTVSNYSTPFRPFKHQPPRSAGHVHAHSRPHRPSILPPAE